jgi:magnesium chelatase subunit D
MSVDYPLSAIVGQEALVEALVVNAVAPDIGGVLIRGERGTAKSTAVRALAPLLPPVWALEGQAFAFGPGDLALDGRVADDAVLRERAAPLVELPLGTTLDRLVGALDLGRALAGERAFEPGLLARAHRGILYVDEVNLLPDHLVDALLDAAASQIARVEREAVSAEHSAHFLLVGTMNVEEGDLRPQLLDRFGLGIEVHTPGDPAVRAEIVRRRLAFDRDREAFAAAWREADEALAARIANARRLVERVRLPERELLRITGACAALGIDGVRGDIVTARTARALAALEGAHEVGEQHVRRAAALALSHRRRRDPLDGHTPSDEDVQRALDDDPDPPPRGDGAPAPQGGAAGEAPEADAGQAAERGTLGAPGPAPARSDAAATPAHLPPGVIALPGAGRGSGGRRARSAGRGAGAIDSRVAPRASEDLAIVASLRARLGGETSAPLREHVRAGREGVLLCLVVDASGSMGAQRRLSRVKGALAGLLRDAYARRDRVAVVAFRDDQGEVLVAPGAPLEQAARALAGLPTGGRTPLVAGLRTAETVIRREVLRDAARRSVAVIVTDGRVQDPYGEIPRAAASLARAADAVEVVDTEDGPVRLGLAHDLARAAGARVHRLLPATPARRAA